MPLATYGQMYGAQAPGDGGVIDAITPGAAETASNFERSDYVTSDKAPAMAWLALILALVVLRVGLTD